jgi:hypothetical protein
LGEWEWRAKHFKPQRKSFSVSQIQPLDSPEPERISPELTGLLPFCPDVPTEIAAFFTKLLKAIKDSQGRVTGKRDVPFFGRRSFETANDFHPLSGLKTCAP